MIGEAYTVQNFRAGEMILIEGELAKGLYLIRKGRVEIYRNPGRETLTLGIATRGQFLGEMSILLGTPCSASARAMEEVEVAIFPREICDNQLRAAPNWLISLARGLAHRLDLTNNKLKLQEQGLSVATQALDLEWEGQR